MKINFLILGVGSMVPVYSILLYVCFCMIGLLSLPWTMAAEVFPTEIREYVLIIDTTLHLST